VSAPRRLLIAGVVVAAAVLPMPMPISTAWASTSRPQQAPPTDSPNSQSSSTQSTGSSQATDTQSSGSQSSGTQPSDGAASSQAASAPSTDQQQQQADQQPPSTADAAAQAAAQQAAAQQAAQQAAQEAARQAALAAKHQAELQAQAVKRAAQDAAAAQRGRVIWDRRGRPSKLVIVRATSIDSLAGGALVQRVVRNGRTVSLAALDSAIPTSWMSIQGDTARLDATVVLTPTTLLDVEGVKSLQLAGGASGADAAILYTGSGRLQLRAVTVTSVDPASGQPVGANSPGRPYIVVAAAGRLDATDAQIDDLGTNPVGDDHGHPAVSFGRGSTGSLVGSALLRNSTGLVLAGSRGVRLQDVTADDSVQDGVVLRADRDTVLSGIKAERNGNDGVLVSGQASNRPITGISTTGNHAYGVSVTGQTGAEVSNLTLSGDQAGGLELSRVTNAKVHNITTADEPNGVFTHVNTTNVVLDAITVNGGRTGILEEKTTSGLHVTGSTINTVHVAGMEIGGHDTVLDGLTVNGSRTAIRVERGAAGLTADKVALVGGTDGLVTSGGTSGVVLNGLTTSSIGNDAIRSLSPGMKVNGGQISGGTTGMDLQASTTVTGLQIGLTSTGIRGRMSDPITLDDVKIDAVALGIDAQPGSKVSVRDCSVHALEAVRGTVSLLGVDDLSLPPLNLLGAIGLPLVALAVLLETFHLLRQRRFGPTRRMQPPLLAAQAR
jgi:Right handed beta helix region